MRIAFVVHDFTVGLGHGRYTFELARRFSREHDVHVFSNTADTAGAENVRFHHIPAVRSNALATIGSFLLPATARVGANWDIIHAQGACCLRFDVITAHICNAGWAEAQRSSRLARTWRQAVFERIVTPLEHMTYRAYPGAEVIAISDQVRRELAHYYGRADPVTVIHHGVDTAAFAPVSPSARTVIRGELGIGETAVVALFVGDLRKGAEVALEALAQTSGVDLVLVSRSDPQPYAARAAALGITDRVSFHPGTSAIARYYAAADIFLFPSPYDAFGMVVSEAMASGMAVITTSRAGASELIRDGHSGFVVDSASDPAPIAAHVARLAADRTLRASVGAAARAAVIDQTWDHVARRTMEVYERAHGSRTRRAAGRSRSGPDR